MMVSSIAILFAIVFFAVGITTAYKGKAAQTVTFAVSILVAFVPEGLPSVVTLLWVGFYTRGSSILCNMQTVNCRKEDGQTECLGQRFARRRNIGYVTALLREVSIHEQLQTGSVNIYHRLCCHRS
jgi:hypothetical protein